MGEVNVTREKVSALHILAKIALYSKYIAKNKRELLDFIIVGVVSIFSWLHICLLWDNLQLGSFIACRSCRNGTNPS
jgi:hypothetical protein